MSNLANISIPCFAIYHILKFGQILKGFLELLYITVALTFHLVSKINPYLIVSWLMTIL
jgi:hypothetical protein